MGAAFDYISEESIPARIIFRPRKNHYVVRYINKLFDEDYMAVKRVISHTNATGTNFLNRLQNQSFPLFHEQYACRWVRNVKKGMNMQEFECRTRWAFFKNENVCSTNNAYSRNCTLPSQLIQWKCFGTRNQPIVGLELSSSMEENVQRSASTITLLQNDITWSCVAQGTLTQTERWENLVQTWFVAP